MATSGNKSMQLYAPKVKAAYTNLYTYSNGFVEVWLSMKKYATLENETK